MAEHFDRDERKGQGTRAGGTHFKMVAGGCKPPSKRGEEMWR
jgi:hypothetical protein